MKKFGFIFLALALTAVIANSDLWARGGGRGGGGGGGRGGGGGGGMRGGGGGGMSMGGGGGRMPSASRPSMPAQRPSMPASRPSMPSSRPGMPAGPGGARPSQPIAGQRPSAGPRPGPGGGVASGARPGQLPATGARPGGARPGGPGGPGGLPGGAGGNNRPGNGLSGNAPGARPGNRPTNGQLNDFLDIGGGAGVNRPSTLPSNRAGNIAGAVAGGIAGGAAADFLRNSGPTAGNLPANTPGGDRPGNGIGNQPGIGNGIGNRPGIDNGIGNRPGVGDGIGNRPGIGEGPIAGNRPDRIENRQERAQNRTDRRDEIRNEFADNHPWADFWQDHPGWAAWRLSTPYAWATWGALSSWMPYGWSEPMDYGYGESVYYQDSGVYSGTEMVATEEVYTQQAEQIAASVPENVDAASQEWLPLGVFALTADGQKSGPTPTLFLQLVVSKQGIVNGTLHNTSTKTTQDIEGMVDKASQRSAWTVKDKSRPIMETGVANLTKDTAPALVHFEDGTTQQWLMVRLEDPAANPAAKPAVNPSPNPAAKR